MDNIKRNPNRLKLYFSLEISLQQIMASFYEEKKADIIVYGYIRDKYPQNMIKDVIELIYIFYDKYLHFNVTNSNGIECLTDNEYKYFSLNNDTVFGIDINNEFHCISDGIYGPRITVMDGDSWKYCTLLTSYGTYNLHGFVYTNNNELYAFGENYYSEAGIEGNIDAPKLIHYEFDSILKQIECGNHYTLFLTLNGNVYGCGDNRYDQLLSSNNSSMISKIFSDNNIIKIGCCKSTSIVLTNKNKLKKFGVNIEIDVDDEIPYDGIMTVPESNIIDFDCGYQHFGYITNNYELYMCGQNTFRECGIKSKKEMEYCASKSFIYNNIKKIIHIKCGWWYTIIKTDKNEYYSFGENSHKQLLLNIDKDKCLPTLISLQYIKKNITKSNKPIIDLIPGYQKTYIIQEC